MIEIMCSPDGLITEVGFAGASSLIAGASSLGESDVAGRRCGVVRGDRGRVGAGVGWRWSERASGAVP